MRWKAWMLISAVILAIHNARRHNRAEENFEELSYQIHKLRLDIVELKQQLNRHIEEEKTLKIDDYFAL